MEKDIITAIRSELKLQADEATKNSAHRFFKEPVTFYGVKTSLVSKIAARYYQDLKSCSKDEVFALCEQLLQSDYGEEAFIAFGWSYRQHKQYLPADIDLFEKWLTAYVNNWAKCDTFCNHTVGAFIEKYPQYIDRLKTWTRSDNRWVRRAAAVTLIVPAKKGLFLNDIFEIAAMLLLDRDDLVQKGYGWMLKEAGRLHQQDVFEFIMHHKKVMPRTALRYAIEKMPGDMKQQAMEK